MRLLLATNNPGKVMEISRVLAGLPLEMLTPKDLPDPPGDPQETEATIAGNALLKARHYRQDGLSAVGDDSGIFVSAFPGELGVHTRRWGAGPQASDAEYIAHFLDRLRDAEDRRARFVCVLALVDADGTEHLFEGTCEGTITRELQGSYPPGLPFDGCFIPEGFDRVFAQLTPEQKNSTSHRGRALMLFRRHLEQRL